ncbi:FUSC family protein [Sulfuricurvum sp.]|uniref:FUSC family protein n=1 Tax=Sulfuricurvum sp. TaxID=2025608 RepID=UPI002614BA9F|nr:FUSC family protein [Sulfuricurvum sp.]MDD2266841.1 FUSC family protein [Sulfuricurvum sp.]MDD2783854.1 FUSC family protein [Sulfuricurvum sp.]
MQPNSALLTNIKSFPWQRGLYEWRTNDAPTLIYMAKATLAGLLALWISMTLNLPDPRTAIFTVFIVMQPQSGLVFSKSYYRVLGTVAGVGMSLILMGMFAQDPVWFISFFALWIGIATAAGFKYRNFQSYGFVLAGYTLCIVALPVIETPLDIFDIATSRFSEVLVGIICATLISDIIFPRRLLDSLIASERERFLNVLTTLADPKEVFAPISEANGGVARFSSGVVGLNAVRINSSFESGSDQKERQHYQHLNHQYMNLSTTFHSLKSILTAIKIRGGKEALSTLEALYAPISAALKTLPSSPMTPEELEGVIQKLLEVKNTIQEDFETKYAAIRETMDEEWEDQFTSAGYLMIRLLDELHSHCVTYLSLLKHRLSGKSSLELSRAVRFSTHTDNVLVALAALRGSGVLLVTMMFWIWTAWPFATLTITLAVVIGLLLGTLPSPLDGVVNFFKGAVLALMLAALYDFYLIPQYTSDMLTLSLLIAPVLAFVGWMTTKPKLGIFAFGFVFMFMSQCALDPYYKIEPTKFMEASLASLIGIMFGGLAYLLVNFWSCSLTQQRVAKILRRQIVNLCDGSIAVERSALESTGRDLVQQFSTQGRLNMRSSRLVYEWLLSTLEIGRAILAIRRSQQRLYSHYRHPKIESSLLCIKNFFDAPSLELRKTLLQSLSETIRMLREENIPTENIQMKRMKHLITELALIHTVLQNDLSLPIATEDSCR